MVFPMVFPMVLPGPGSNHQHWTAPMEAPERQFCIILSCKQTASQLAGFSSRKPWLQGGASKIVFQFGFISPNNYGFMVFINYSLLGLIKPTYKLGGPPHCRSLLSFTLRKKLGESKSGVFGPILFGRLVVFNHKIMVKSPLDDGLPSGKTNINYGKNHHFSIAMFCFYQRVKSPFTSWDLLFPMYRKIKKKSKPPISFWYTLW